MNGLNIRRVREIFFIFVSGNRKGQEKGQRVLKAVRIKGVSYYMDPSSRELFDYATVSSRGVNWFRLHSQTVKTEKNESDKREKG